MRQLTKLHIILLAVFALVVTGIVVLAVARRQPAATQPRPATTTADEPQPSEAPINKNTYTWPGKPDEPKYLSMPTIRTEGFVERVGTNAKRQISVPSNTNLAGWYSASQKPGQPGLSIIDGHVDGATRPTAIFSNLKRLKVGDEFSLTLGNGNVLRYRTLSVTEANVADALNVLTSQDPNTPSQLNLITCTGTYEANVRSYDRRVVVSAAYVH